MRLERQAGRQAGSARKVCTASMYGVKYVSKVCMDGLDVD